MEDKYEQDEFDEMDFDENQIVKIQAFVKGELVRKWFTELKDEYEKVVLEVEKNTGLTVEWPSSGFGPPKVRKQRPTSRKKINNVKSDDSARNSPVPDCCLKQGAPFSVCHTQDNCDLIVQENDCIRQKMLPVTSPDTVSTAFKPLTTDQSSGVSEQPCGQISKCAIETQTSLDKDDFLEEIFSPGEITHEKRPVRTYDMLIQTDDLSMHDEPKKNETVCREPVSNQSSINRQLLEQKIHKFESKLQSLRVMSEQGCSDQTKSKEKTSVTSPRQNDNKYSPDANADKGSLSPSSVRPASPKIDRDKGPHAPSPGRPSYHHESSVLTNVTSVWDSFNSECKDSSGVIYPSDPEALRQMRKNVSMELLWVQQAIDSRKNYLKLKSQMRTTT